MSKKNEEISMASVNTAKAAVKNLPPNEAWKFLNGMAKVKPHSQTSFIIRRLRDQIELDK